MSPCDLRHTAHTKCRLHEQFLKAVRDKEGNALRNSHVVGFFRRICKLLFFGIKPVFVFDGGAPALKRQTISSRKRRREGRREDAVRTAGKLLALQMQRRAEEDEAKRRDAAARPTQRQEEELPDELVYVDELQMTTQERQQGRKFKKKDQYHLPDLDVSMAEMGGPNDPRVMSLEELEAYAQQFNSGEDINVYDFSKIDFNSPFFLSLPASDRYNILNAARLRSRLRMGLSKDQLDDMFPDRMAFSRFQIERVKERNELTQRLMHVNGMVEDMFGVDGTGRVAGEKGREYVLVKNAGVEGGWALGVIGDKDEGERSKPIDVDELDRRAQQSDSDEEDDEDDGFEDVPIEGLNRLPRRKVVPGDDEEALVGSHPRSIPSQRRAGYGSRRRGARAPARARPARSAALEENPNSLFVDDEDDLADGAPTDADDADEEEDELQRAIALSLQPDATGFDEEAYDDEFEEVFQQKKADDSNPNFAASRGKFASLANSRAMKATPASMPFAQSMEDGEDDLDFEDALDVSKQSNLIAQKIHQDAEEAERVRVPSPPPPISKPAKAFSGPLPFEKLDLGSSLLGKKAKKLAEESAGGFEKPGLQKEKKAGPLPPWFSGDVKKDIDAQKVIEDEDRKRTKDFEEEEDEFNRQMPPRLRKEKTGEVIDLDALDDDPQTIDVDAPQSTPKVIDLDSDDEKPELANTKQLRSVPVEDNEIRMGDLADMVRAAPPRILSPTRTLDIIQSQEATKIESQQDLSNLGAPKAAANGSASEKKASLTPGVNTPAKAAPVVPASFMQEESNREEEEEEVYEWEASDNEGTTQRLKKDVVPAGGNLQPVQRASSIPEFENIAMPETEIARPATPQPTDAPDADEMNPIPMSGLADDNAPLDDSPSNDDGQDVDAYSDPEDDELLHALAVEAEEHARFASSLNHRPQADNAADYERELRALRSQQKKDRRDADEVTQIMVQECQQLLKLFGLPFITAPMEAEAQCAELVRLNLVDGIVTDDSDIFLFGGTRVYKNMFNQAKFVECYLAADLARDYALDRANLIACAHLLGSDYTDGLPGVGPVTALEILAEFPAPASPSPSTPALANAGLSAFSTWWTSVQNASRPATSDASSPFRKKFRRTHAAKIFLPPAFPDPRVTAAYLAPEVDADPSAFQWGVPDLAALRAFLSATIGWSEERTDEVLVPVIRDMNRRGDEGTQSNITRFLEGGATVGVGAREVAAPRRRGGGGSARLESALERLAEGAKRRGKGGVGTVGGEGADAGVAKDGGVVVEAEACADARPAAKPRKTASRKRAKPRDGAADDDDAEDDDLEAPSRPARKKARGKTGSRRKRAAAGQADADDDEDD